MQQTEDHPGSNSPRIGLLVVEPCQRSCDSLVNNLLSTARFSRVVGTKTISAAKRAGQSAAFDIALISREITEQKERACDLVHFFANLPRPIRSLLIAEEWSRADIIQAFSYGAKGLLSTRSYDLERVSKAIACVYSGQVWANSEQLNYTLDYFAGKASNGRAGTHIKSALSKREGEIAQLLARGASNKEIARALHISERTVKNHLGKIFEKIGVTSRVQAALRLTGSDLHHEDPAAKCESSLAV